jgi:histidinol-phosphate aminotransferase
MAMDFKSLTHPGIQSLVPYQPGKSIEALAREKGLTDIIKLASNENPLGCSPLALNALHAMSATSLSLYPSALNHPLMHKLAARLGMDPSWLFLGNGSDSIFNTLLHCFALHKDKHIVTHEYAFSTYAIQAHSLNIPVRKVPVHCDWRVNVEALIEACDAQTALVFLANPNNPTGLLLSQSDIKRVLDELPEHTLFVLDEAYYEFVAKEQTISSIDLVRRYPNLVLTRTFSKLYGLAGLRLGYALGHPELIALLHRVQLPFAVNQPALVGAFAALDDEDFIELSVRTNRLGMKQMCLGLDELGLSYLPSTCNFVTFDCKEDGLLLYNFLLDKGIIVRPLHPYKMDSFIRVSIGTSEQNERFLTALRAYFSTRN